MTSSWHLHHPRSHWVSLALLACLSAPVLADTAVQTAQARYEADKRLCIDEASSEARLQCRRDALAVYDKALAAARVGAKAPDPAACADCGRVSAVQVSNQGGGNNAIGVIAGGVTGAVLGHQVGGGFGNSLATIAGAAVGAYAGKKIQENMNTSKVWTVTVNFSNGSSGQFTFNQEPGFAVGDAVKRAGDGLVRN